MNAENDTENFLALIFIIYHNKKEVFQDNTKENGLKQRTKRYQSPNSTNNFTSQPQVITVCSWLWKQQRWNVATYWCLNVCRVNETSFFFCYFCRNRIFKVTPQTSASLGNKSTEYELVKTYSTKNIARLQYKWTNEKEHDRIRIWVRWRWYTPYDEAFICIPFYDSSMNDLVWGCVCVCILSIWVSSDLWVNVFNVLILSELAETELTEIILPNGT